MLETSEEKADAIIAGMISAGVTMAAVPVMLQVPFMGVLAGGVVGIGTSYGVTLTKAEGRKLVKEFFKAAGFTYAATIVGGKLISVAVAVTGIGYPGAVALDAVTSAAEAYAVGAAAKHYFAGDKSRRELGAVMRNAFNEKKREAVF